MITILKETPKDPITLMGRRAGVCWGGDINNEEKNYKGAWTASAPAITGFWSTSM